VGERPGPVAGLAGAGLGVSRRLLVADEDAERSEEEDEDEEHDPWPGSNVSWRGEIEPRDEVEACRNFSRKWVSQLLARWVVVVLLVVVVVLVTVGGSGDNTCWRVGGAEGGSEDDMLMGDFWGFFFLMLGCRWSAVARAEGRREVVVGVRERRREGGMSGCFSIRLPVADFFFLGFDESTSSFYGRAVIPRWNGDEVPCRGSGKGEGETAPRVRGRAGS
jgi:hypothetical protein